ncbi:DUF3043 domain-containing protein [Aestuariimicrobium sp. T2.26MG-19.2B]|uniref:DUF3043 domain-containing protein n=1 Tax=Aestuariimicrobium sp. T2.26MG-19.2B TaxID=3040679 RepID=UPI002477549B|nr:DUF3043 domain-containing protein [Aestuariimicrobium sp. T2.26MG-19.2B]CAI9399786.1 putative protein [Aestuariimicrobium sp. T2.26MG-19.2B]
MALFRPYQQTTADERAEAKAKLSQARVSQSRTEAVDDGADTSVSPRRTKQPAAPAVAPPVVDAERTAPRLTPKKDRPTPTRAEAEAARKARVNPQLSGKDAKRALRERNRTVRMKAMAEAENEPTKALLRDYIDHRWTLTEFLMPTMILLAALSIGFGRFLLAQQVFSLAMLALFIGWIINVWVVWRGFKKQAHERLSQPNFRGLLMYANNRMLQIRRFRQPPARINRGEAY